jgi:hypothetical protein
MSVTASIGDPALRLQDSFLVKDRGKPAGSIAARYARATFFSDSVNI